MNISPKFQAFAQDLAVLLKKHNASIDISGAEAEMFVYISEDNPDEPVDDVSSVELREANGDLVCLRLNNERPVEFRAP